jgi:hypothetical protein
MNYVIRRYSLFFLLFLVFETQNLNAQFLDTLYTVPNSPFLKKILQTGSNNLSINLSKENKLIPTVGTLVESNAQELIKYKNDLYVIISQTGILYQLISSDSSQAIFRKLDKTVNLNYNINCRNLIFQNQIYSYGGYGFWKTNGHLRKFNREDHEWDIIPTNIEVINTDQNWFNEQMGRLYVPFKRIVNAGLIGPENIKGLVSRESYYLDLQQKQWVKLGSLTDQAFEILLGTNTSPALNLENGFIVLSNDQTYYFDFVHNKIYKSKSAELNQFLIRRVDFTNMFYDKGDIYSYKSSNKQFIKYPVNLASFELLSDSIWGYESMVIYITIGLLLLASFIIFAIWLFNRSVKRKLEVAQMKILKSKSITQTFVGTELALVDLLIKAAQKNSKVDIHDINHVLGIKDKNIGLQKKVRSDTINAINEKYHFITQAKSNLIISIRKEDDKRFFEYFVESSQLNTIKRIIENN